jgi:protein-tyrosine phosphatase
VVQEANDARWIALDGAVNVRDLGGLPLTSGGTVAANRLIRADNLQDLTATDVRRLVDDVGVRAVADLRTEVEVDATGPGPLTREARVRIEHLSLLPTAGARTDAVADEGDAPPRLPWNDPARVHRWSAANTYLRYLVERPDSVVAALRLVASTTGATVVHCAAGKDRTGVVVALALEEVGVDREVIVADYARSTERMAQIMARLAATPVYAADLEGRSLDSHAARRETMETFLADLDARFGGPSGWLRAHGFRDEDGVALRRRILD